MENNSTETVVKPTNKERMQIFSQYWGQLIVLVGDAPELRPLFAMKGENSICVGTRIIGQYAKQEIELWYKATECSLGVKHLSKINDEDLREVAILGGAKLTLEWHAKTILQFMDSPACINLTGSQWGKIFDFLRSRGYALPSHGWSVGELCDFGIFKIVE